MDDITHLVLLLDRRMSEQQDLLRTLVERQKAILAVLKRLPQAEERKTSSERPLSFSALLKLLASNTGQAVGGIVAMAYVVRGGDIGHLLELFIKASQ